MKRIAWATSVGLACLSIGCGASDPDEPISSTSERILDGTIDKTDSGAVGLAVDFFGSFGGHCSGTLIAPNLVLTARHCVSLINNSLQTKSVTCGQDNFGITGGGTMFRATALVVRPNVDGPGYYKGTGNVAVPQNATDACGNDVALIQLEGAGIPADVAKPIVPRIDSKPEQGESYSAIGYGLTDPSNPSSSGTRMRVDGKAVDCLGGQCAGPWGINVKETEWSGEGGVCDGDSGGPAIDAQGRVMGVVSRSGSGCSPSIYGDVSSWKDLLIQTAKSAAQAGGYAVPFWAETGSSTPVSTTDGGTGDSGTSGGTEGATCSQAMPCGAGFKCYAASGDTGNCAAACVDSSTCGAGKTCDSALQICLANSKPKGQSSSDGGGCSFVGPVKPTPWLVGAALGASVALVCRRRRRRR